MKETYWLIYRGNNLAYGYNSSEYELNFTKAKPFTNKKAAVEWCNRNNCELVDVISNNKNNYVTINVSSDSISKIVEEAVKEELRKWALGI